MDLSHYCYEEAGMSVKQIGDPTFPLGDIHCSNVKGLFVSMRALALYRHNGMIYVMRYAEQNVTNLSIEDAIGEEERKKVLKEGFKMILLYAITVVALCASPKQKVHTNGVGIRCVLSKSSKRTVRQLDRPSRSSCC